MWRLLSEELRAYRPILLTAWAFGAGIFGLVLAMLMVAGDANDRAQVGTIATHLLPLALLIASMVAGFIVTGVEWSENRVRLLVMLPFSLGRIALARVCLPVAMLVLGLLLSHASLAALLALQGTPDSWPQQLVVEFVGLQMLLWVQLALVTREVIQLRKARGLRAGLAPVALVIGVIVLAGWLLAVALHDQVSGSAVLAGVNGAMAAITFAMFRRRSDFTR